MVITVDIMVQSQNGAGVCCGEVCVELIGLLSGGTRGVLGAATEHQEPEHHPKKKGTDSKSQIAIVCPRTPATSRTRSLYSPKAVFGVTNDIQGVVLMEHTWSHKCWDDTSNPLQSLCRSYVSGVFRGVEGCATHVRQAKTRCALEKGSQKVISAFGP